MALLCGCKPLSLTPLFGGSRVYHGPLLKVFSFLSCPFLFLLAFIKVSLPRRLLTTHTRHTHTHTRARLCTVPLPPQTALVRLHASTSPEHFCVFFLSASRVLRLPSSTLILKTCVHVCWCNPTLLFIRYIMKMSSPLTTLLSCLLAVVSVTASPDCSARRRFFAGKPPRPPPMAPAPVDVCSEMDCGYVTVPLLIPWFEHA